MPRDDKGLDEYDSIFTLSSYTIEILQSALKKKFELLREEKQQEWYKSDCVAV